MEVFLSYFDVLGFKEFIDKHDDQHINLYMEALTLSSQQAITNMRIRKDRPQPDFDGVTVNCLHVSDSLVFWTKDDSLDSFNELINVTYNFNWLQNLFNLPVRGCLVHGNMEYKPFGFFNKLQTEYSRRSIYGKALISAYTGAEYQNWAGTFIHESAKIKVGETVINELITQGIIKSYNIPFKDKKRMELAFRFSKQQFNEISFKNTVGDLDRAFSNSSKNYKKDKRVMVKFNNTVKFLETDLEGYQEKKCLLNFFNTRSNM